MKNITAEKQVWGLYSRIMFLNLVGKSCLRLDFDNTHYKVINVMILKRLIIIYLIMQYPNIKTFCPQNGQITFP